MGMGKRIKNYIEDKDIKQKVLAKEIGVADRTLNNYLNEKRAMPEDILIKIMDRYNLSANYVLGRTGQGKGALDQQEYDLIAAVRTLKPEQREIAQGLVRLMQEQNNKK